MRFTNKETQAPRNKVTCPRVHTGLSEIPVLLLYTIASSYNAGALMKKIVFAGFIKLYQFYFKLYVPGVFGSHSWPPLNGARDFYHFTTRTLWFHIEASFPKQCKPWGPSSQSLIILFRIWARFLNVVLSTLKILNFWGGYSLWWLEASILARGLGPLPGWAHFLTGCD